MLITLTLSQGVAEKCLGCTYDKEKRSTPNSGRLKRLKQTSRPIYTTKSHCNACFRTAGLFLLLKAWLLVHLVGAATKEGSCKVKSNCG